MVQRRTLHCRCFMCLLLRGTLDFAYPRRKVYLLRDQLVSERGQQLSYPTHAKFVICDCTIENGLHDVKDVMMGEDKSMAHCDNGPKIMAALRNTAVSLLRHAGFSTIAARMR